MWIYNYTFCEDLNVNILTSNRTYKETVLAQDIEKISNGQSHLKCVIYF